MTLLAAAVMALVSACSSAGPPGPAEPDDGGPATSTTRATTTPQAPTDLDGCVTSADGELLRHEGASTVADVALLGSGEVGVVVSYETSRDVCQWLPLAERLVSAGYLVLLHDGITGTAPDHVVDRVDLLRERGIDQVALVGGSLGGTGSLLAATRVEPPVEAVVNLSGGSPEVVASAGEIDVPLLQVVAVGDAPAIGLARGIDAAASAAPVHDLVELPGRAHASGLFTTEDAEQVLSTIEAFLREHAPPA